jgi:hypothetical protein
MLLHRPRNHLFPQPSARLLVDARRAQTLQNHPRDDAAATRALLVAADENQNVTTYPTRAGTSQSLMTRHIQDLGDINRHHEEDMGLVESYRDMMDRRNVLIRLNAKGKGVVSEMCEAFV